MRGSLKSLVERLSIGKPVCVSQEGWGCQNTKGEWRARLQSIPGKDMLSANALCAIDLVPVEVVDWFLYCRCCDNGVED